MQNEGQWVTRKSEVRAFARENDGECVIAKVPRPSDEELEEPVFMEDYVTCVFSSPDEARKRKCHPRWDYYFTDEPFIDEHWGLK